MRILLAFLALLTGLSLPGVALAASRTEVADAGIVANMATPVAPRQQSCAARGVSAPQARVPAQPRTIWIPVPAFARPCSVVITDRARE